MTMTNAEFMIENKIDLFRLSCKKRTDEKGAFDILLDDRKIARIYASDNTSEMDALLAWLDRRHKGPILDVKPIVHAHWIERRTNNGNVHYKCSHCGKEVSYPYTKKRWKYCIECGAKMDEEEDSNHEQIQ